MTISRAVAYTVATIAIATGALLYGQIPGAIQPTVTLTWEHPAPETVTHYWLERALRTDFRDADILGPIEGTTYTDHPTTAGRTYYRVRAVGPGGQSLPSAYVQTVIELPPVAPVNLQLTRGL